MKKLLVGLAFAITLSITACGVANTGTVEKSFSMSDSDKTSRSDSFVPGTYVGVHGSGLTLKEDGTVEYYWKEWNKVDTDGSWVCNDNKLELNLSSIHCTIYADVPSGIITSLNLTGNIMWDDEIYVRVSDDTSEKSVSEYVDIIKKQLKTEIEVPEETNSSKADQPLVKKSVENSPKYSLYDITFQVPGEYTHEGEIFYKYDGMVVIGFMDFGDGMTDESFLESDTEIDSRLAQGIQNQYSDAKIVSSSESTVSKLYSRRYEIESVDQDGQPIIVQIELINIPNRNKLVAVLAASGDDQYDDEMKEDFDRVLDNAKYSGKKKTQLPDKASIEEKQTTVPGVDPDLVKFLKEYEAFVDEYCDLLYKYYQNPTNLTLLNEYSQMMIKYESFMKAIDQYDSSDMTTADAAYYLEVYNRCTQKMLTVAGSMSGN